MTTLTSVLLSGLTGLRAAQTGVSVASQNIANANTPGYVRAELTLTPRTDMGPGGGVEVGGIRRAADRFLATASYIAGAAHGAASIRNDILSRAQAAFGDPAGDTSMFAALDQFWSALTEVGVDPSSGLRRADAVNALQTTFAEAQRIGRALQDFTIEADQRIGDAVSEAQDLMNRISALNREIQLTQRAGADPTAAQNAQAAMINQLSGLMDITVTEQNDGGVHVRTSGGALLVGVEAAEISYTPSSAPYAAHGTITLNASLGTNANLEPFLRGGEIGGLLQLRDRDLPGLSEALGGFAANLADALNEVHNENASSPPVGDLVGRQSGLIGTDAIGFSGRAIIGIVDSTGALTQRLTIDFDTLNIIGEAPAANYSFAGGELDDFAAALDAALGAATPAGSADFSGGVLSMSVGSSGGLVVQQDPAAASDRGGRGFAHFFGLNDLVSRETPLFFETGLRGADLHGLTSGDISYEVRDSSGRFIAQRTVSIAGPLAGATSDWDELVTALNANGTGLGEYGVFALNAATGKLSFTPNPAFKVSLLSDSTVRGDTGVSMTSLTGLSPAATAGRALEVDINAQVQADTSRLAVGKPDLTLAIGETVVEGGDNHGSAALLAARDAARLFPGAGVLSAQTTTLAIYAARLGGEAGRLAADAKRGADSAQAVATAANDRRSEIESVSLDDELMRMTTYQNAYAAAARVIQAATDMLDVLMTLGYR